MRGKLGLTAWPALAALALLTCVPDGAGFRAAASSHPGWTVVADSQETLAMSGAAANAIDGDPSTIWRSRYTGGEAALPHTLTLDTGGIGPMSGVVLTPRQDNDSDGRIGRFRVLTSVNGSAWSPAASGVLANTVAPKTIEFPAVNARYVRIVAVTEADGTQTSTSLAELSLLTSAPAAPAAGTGRWSLPVNLPLVPVAGAMLPTGKLLLWSSYKPDTYGAVGAEPAGTAKTQTMTFDPATGSMSARSVTETDHDMFCPGTALLADGRLLVNGGSSDTKTSLYDPKKGTWSVGAPLAIKRGYQTAVTTSRGAVFTLGGSWDNPGNDVEGTPANPFRDGELWTAAAGSHLLPGAPVAPILTNDAGGIYRQDNHPWLFAWKNGLVFDAGPSKAMHWYDTTGKGSVTSAGLRGADADAMNGSAAMYDIGKVLVTGGAPSYTDSIATDHAYAIDINQPTPVVTTLSPMANARAFATSVVLPDGTVLVVGGQGFAHPFSDATAVLTPELFNPVTGRFRAMAPMQVPRDYHSIALLMPDGRVFVGGGGLCGSAPTCTSNHTDAEIYTPPYLLSSTGALVSRPAISSAPASAAAGGVLAVRTTRAVTRFALVRMSSVTHSVDTDQRRVPLTIKPGATATAYSLVLPADHGVLVPGAYLLFALDSRGVPSVGKVIQVS